MNHKRKRKDEPFYPLVNFGMAAGHLSNRPFHPLQHLKWLPEREEITSDFRRLIFPLLTTIFPGDEQHHYIYNVARKLPFTEFWWMLNKPDAVCDARQIILMLERQKNEKVGYYSDEFVNLARVGPTLWIRIRYITRGALRGRWELHAFDTSEPGYQERSANFKLMRGMRIISRRGAV